MPTRLLMLALAVLVAAGTLPSGASGETAPVIGFVSDFGLANEAVGVCEAVMLKTAPDARVVHVCHQVPAYDIWEGAIVLRETAVFPKGSAIVAVIDPGVGTARRAIAMRTRAGLVYIAPDNGLLTLVAEDQGIDAVVALKPELVNADWRPGTFDGRDLFSPAAAVLAHNGGDLAAVGSTIDAESLVRVPLPAVAVREGEVDGYVEREDRPYGNALTCVTSSQLEAAGLRRGERLMIAFAEGRTAVVPFVGTFGDVKEGEALAYLDARGRLALAVNQDNFSRAYAVAPRQGFTVSRAPAEKPGEAAAP